MPDYFHSSNNKETDNRVNETITSRINNESINLFSGIGCFEGTFSLQVKEDNCPYQALPRRVAYALQKTLKEDLEQPQKQKIIVGCHFLQNRI